MRSACVVADLILPWLQPKSVVDVGCGIGTWLRAFADRGVTRVLGFDGDYVDRSALRIPADSFRAVNLVESLHMNERFDLAICLEVGEHLPAAAAPTLVASLTQASDVCLFSAAVPGQGGTNHINEQWPSYWVELFRKRGFIVRDWLRPVLWENEQVEWWYTQNMIIFLKDSGSASVSDPGWAHFDPCRPPSLVHPRRVGGAAIPRVSRAASLLLSSVTRAIKKRLP